MSTPPTDQTANAQVAADLSEFVSASPSSYHATAAAAARLDAAGFHRLDEREPWALESGRGYYVVRDGAIIAWMTPAEATTTASAAANENAEAAAESAATEDASSEASADATSDPNASSEAASQAAAEADNEDDANAAATAAADADPDAACHACPHPRLPPSARAAASSRASAGATPFRGRRCGGRRARWRCCSRAPTARRARSAERSSPWATRAGARRRPSACW